MEISESTEDGFVFNDVRSFLSFSVFFLVIFVLGKVIIDVLQSFWGGIIFFIAVYIFVSSADNREVFKQIDGATTKWHS